MSSRQVEMPDGNTLLYTAQTILELKRKVALTLGVDPEEVGAQDDSGRPIPDSSVPPETTRIIPKPKWGGDYGN